MELMRRPQEECAGLLTLHALLRDAETDMLLLTTEACAPSSVQALLQKTAWSVGSPLAPRQLQALLRGALAGLADLSAMVRPPLPPRPLR